MTIERAAKVLEAANGGETPFNLWEDQFRSAARAALEAIAEPTPEMIEAGGMVEIDGPAEKVLPNIWRAMHAAMLKEPK